MQGTETKIQIYCYESDSTHNIYLYYGTEKENRECFLDLIKKAKVSNNTNCIIIKIPKGTIEVNRYFIKDYNEDRKYKIVVSSIETEIENAVIKFSDDKESSNYDMHFIKDIELSFNENDCRQSEA